MASFEELDQIKNTLMKVDVHVKQLIKELYDVTSMEQINSLNSDINSELKKYKLLQNQLKDYIEECQIPEEKEMAKTHLQGFVIQFESNWQLLKKAYAFSKKKLEHQMTNELFNRSDDYSQLTRRNANADKLAQNKGYMAEKSANITGNLYQITKLMSEQVQQSNAALNALVTSSATVTETQEEVKMMGNHLISSRTLLTKYGRREFTDKLVIVLAALFFFSCVLYVIMKRLF